MKQQLINISKAAVLAVAIFAAGTLASCSDDHEGFGAGMEGSIPLVLGEVSVDTPATAHTRAAVTENGKGYTGIRKSRFVNGDVLTLTLQDGDAVSETVTATLTGGKWVLNKLVYVTAATTLTATYTAAEQVTGIAADNLAASTFTLADRKLNIAMLHAGVMIDITADAAAPVPSSVSVITEGGVLATAPEEVTENGKAVPHYRAIAAPGKVTQVSAVINGVTYAATLATPLTTEANKRYPVQLAFKESVLTATAGAAASWAEGGDVPPTGYTRIIATAEDLAQFAKEVNDDKAGTGASIAKVIQVADIDLGTLKSSPNYSATADNWVPIGTSSPSFKGTYNGNGHTISNLKISTATLEYTGLFGHVESGTLVGIHLRNCNIASTTSNGWMGALAGVLSRSSVSLCSAAGSISSQNASATAGFVGLITGSYVSRCSADVDVNSVILNGSGRVAGFGAACVASSVVAGCMASGNITWTNNGGFGCQIAGFMSESADITAIGCCFNGSLQSADKYPAFMTLRSNTTRVNIISCYTTSTGKEFALAGSNAVPSTLTDIFTDCAWTGTTTQKGVTGNLAATGLRAALTATDASLAGVKTHHWSAANGYTTDPVTATWCASLIWKDNTTGAPTIDLSYEGTPLYEDKLPNLLSVPGGTPYWVAPEDAGTDVVWSATLNDLCPDGWHVPSKEEFVAMTGITTTGSWMETNYAAIAAAFPIDLNYWSSTESGSKAWNLYVYHDGTSNIGTYEKTRTYRVRCVRKVNN